MSIDTSLQGLDLYLRSTDTTGRVTLSEHRVWDASRFIAARQAEASDANTKATAKQEPAKASAQQITREQFKRGN